MILMMIIMATIITQSQSSSTVDAMVNMNAQLSVHHKQSNNGNNNNNNNNNNISSRRHHRRPRLPYTHSPCCCGYEQLPSGELICAWRIPQWLIGRHRVPYDLTIEEIEMRRTARYERETKLFSIASIMIVTLTIAVVPAPTTFVSFTAICTPLMLWAWLYVLLIVSQH
jgi:hypothetical protein